MLAADTGANLRELMERMGHASTRAALIYLHKKAGRDKAIADGLSAMIDKSRAESSKPETDDATETQSRMVGKTLRARSGHGRSTSRRYRETQAS